MEELPQRITAWRVHAGLSVAELAAKCGIKKDERVSTAAVYQWEAGEATPTLKRLDKICEACRTTLAEFFRVMPKTRARAS